MILKLFVLNYGAISTNPALQPEANDMLIFEMDEGPKNLKTMENATIFTTICFISFGALKLLSSAYAGAAATSPSWPHEFAAPMPSKSKLFSPLEINRLRHPLITSPKQKN